MGAPLRAKAVGTLSARTLSARTLSAGTLSVGRTGAETAEGRSIRNHRGIDSGSNASRGGRARRRAQGRGFDVDRRHEVGGADPSRRAVLSHRGDGLTLGHDGQRTPEPFRARAPDARRQRRGGRCLLTRQSHRAGAPTRSFRRPPDRRQRPLADPCGARAVERGRRKREGIRESGPEVPGWTRGFTSVGGDFELTGYPVLESLSALSALESVSGALSIAR